MFLAVALIASLAIACASSGWAQGWDDKYLKAKDVHHWKVQQLYSKTTPYCALVSMNGIAVPELTIHDTSTIGLHYVGFDLLYFLRVLCHYLNEPNNVCKYHNISPGDVPGASWREKDFCYFDSRSRYHIPVDGRWLRKVRRCNKMTHTPSLSGYSVLK